MRHLHPLQPASSVLCDEEVKPFGHGTGAHERLPNLADVRHSVAGLFFGFRADAIFRTGLV